MAFKHQRRRDDYERDNTIRWAFVLVPLAALSIAAISVLTFGLGSCGSVAGAVVDRKVHENSYQNSEARRTEIMTIEAQLAELNGQLGASDLDANTRRGLEGQARALNIRLRTARAKYDQVLLKE